MQESPHAVSSPAQAKRKPLHDEIAQCARDLWVEQGRPADRDLEIWLEAEQRLLSTIQTSLGEDPVSTPAAGPARWARVSRRSTLQGEVTAALPAPPPDFLERSIIMSLSGDARATPESSSEDEG